MADALCGPSNPLQQFKQQTNHDRTLQQDRLTSRPSPAQGFRSPDPNAGLLDPEFEAFQAGVPLAEYQQYLHTYPPPQQQQNLPGPSQAPSWASDFQQMHISPPPLQQQSNRSAANTAGWAQGFRQHITQSGPRAQQTSPLAFQQRARYGYSGFQSNFTPQSAFQPPTQQSKGKEPAYDTFDDAAFEQAFDQARDDMMAEVDTQAEQEHFRSLDLDQQKAFVDNALREAGVKTRQAGLVDAEAVLKEQQDDFRSMDPNQQKAFVDRVLREAGVPAQQEALVNTDAMLKEQQDKFRALDAELQKNIVDDLIDHALVQQKPINQQEEVTTEQKTRQEEDDLAATAQELLEKVSNNNTDKFRNSQFLGLMRKLRDREVKVEGDQMVETAATATTNPTLTTASTTSSSNLFDNSEQRPSPLVPAPFALPPGQRVVDTRPPDYGASDADVGRIDPRDGQEVVDLLNQPAGSGAGEEIGTFVPVSASQWKGNAPFYGDLRSMHGARSEEAGSMSEVLYGEDGSLVGVVPGGRRQGGFAQYANFGAEESR